MLNPYFFLLVAAGFLAGIVLMGELGRRLRLRDIAAGRVGEGSSGVAEGTAFALLGLLIAFTFSGAAERFSERRRLIVDEANIIGTTYLRLDLLADSLRAPLQEKFRAYVDSRLAIYAAVPDMKLVRTHQAASAVLQSQIWQDAVRAAESPASSPRASMLLLPSVNEMLDITTTRTAATLAHPPFVIYALLAGATLICSLMVGYDLGGAARRRWLPLLVFAVVVTSAIYVTIDLEYPRFGLITVESMDQVLVEVRRGM